MRSGCPGCARTHDCYDCHIYTLWDDRKRLELNRSQKWHGLVHNVLNDYEAGKKAGKWMTIRDEQDIDVFLRQLTGFGFWVQK